MSHVLQVVESDRIHFSDGTDTANRLPEEQEMAQEIEQVVLPPTDRGKEAWLVLAGCSLIQIPVWGKMPGIEFFSYAHTSLGYSIAFGVFQEYYGSHPDKLRGDSSSVAVVGTTMTVSF